jgi:hypothetical protein
MVNLFMYACTKQERSQNRTPVRKQLQNIETILDIRAEARLSARLKVCSFYGVHTCWQKNGAKRQKAESKMHTVSKSKNNHQA